jgi:hypothetical protein
MRVIPRVVVRRWLEVVLPLISLGMLVWQYRPQSIPAIFVQDPGQDLFLWVVRAMVFAMLGVWGFSALVVAFFLLFSPVYVINKSPHLVGKGGWLDRREVRFYLLCALLLVLLIVLLYVAFDWAVVLFVLLAGFGPVVWRLLV